LAEAVAAEWEAQEPAIDLRTMPLTKLANSAIDRTRPHRRRAIDEIVKYAGSDLVCYRATEPGELVRRQADVWDAIVSWAGQYLAVEFRVVGGIVFADQPPDAMAAVQTYLGGRSEWELAAIYAMTTLTGSAIVALMLEREAIEAERAWKAVHLDEDWQIEHWGEDVDAKAGRAFRRRDFEAAVRFLQLLK
jgi:chaperone required for assembly of F1-ATPase